MYSFSKFCYCCISADENLKNFSSLSNDNLTILNCTFSAIWTESNNMFICTDCAHNLQKTCDFLNKCRQTCKLLKGYVRQLNQDDSCPKKLVDFTVTLSDFRKQVFELKPCVNTNSSLDSNHKCAENVDNSVFKTLETEPYSEETHSQVKVELEPDLNCDFLPIQPLDIKVELPDSISVDLNASVSIKEEIIEYNFQEEPFIDQVPSNAENQITSRIEDQLPSKNEEQMIKPDEENIVKINNSRKNIKKTYSCCLCSLKFRYRNMLIIHLLIHKQSRNTSKKTFYQCTLCNRSYRLKDAFIKHYLFHNGYRPYKCSMCEKIFKQRTDLTLHMKTNCQDNNERPYKCSVCDKAFKRMAHLNYHKLTHNSLRKYNMCDRCGDQFLNKKLLNRHMLHECKEEDEIRPIAVI